MSDFKLPDLGEGVHEGQIVRLCVREGDTIAEDAPLMEVETDKAAVEIPSPFAGVVSKWHVEEGQLVHVGDVMVTITDSPLLQAAGSGVRASEGQASGTRAAVGQGGGPSPQPSPKGRGGKRTAAAALPSGNGRRKPASPAVRRMAREMGIDLQAIDGSGPGGRITRADVQGAANAVDKFRTKGAPPAEPSPQASLRGRGGRSHDAEHRDANLARIAPVAPTTSLVRHEVAGTADTDAYGPIVRQSLTQARTAIARTMTTSWTTIPHVTDSDDADVTELDKFRRGYADPTDPNRTITMLAFIVRAVVKSLQLFPMFNASFDTETGEIIYKRYYNIAIGVQTERGLVAPVIRDADKLNIGQLSDAIMTIAENARSASFAINDLRGGTFTISNAGAMGGSRYSTPIINPPQVAVLAIGKTRQLPWVVNGELAVRSIMPLSCSFDHRIIDGAQEIAFARQIIDDLENPARLLL